MNRLKECPIFLCPKCGKIKEYLGEDELICRGTPRIFCKICLKEISRFGDRGKTLEEESSHGSFAPSEATRCVNNWFKDTKEYFDWGASLRWKTRIQRAMEKEIQNAMKGKPNMRESLLEREKILQRRTAITRHATARSSRLLMEEAQALVSMQQRKKKKAMTVEELLGGIAALVSKHVNYIEEAVKNA